jgi:hypothetical protein
MIIYLNIFILNKCLIKKYIDVNEDNDINDFIDKDDYNKKNIYTPYDKTFSSGFGLNNLKEKTNTNFITKNINIKIKNNFETNNDDNNNNLHLSSPLSPPFSSASPTANALAEENYIISTYKNFNSNKNDISNNFDPKRNTGFSYKIHNNINNNNGYKTSYSGFANYSKTKNDNNKWVKIQAPDFNRMPSREILEKDDPNKEKKRIIPSRYPSMTAIKQSKIK